MSSWYEPDTPPPPPTQSASFRQIIGMLAFGGLGSYFMVKAIGSRPGQSLYTGGILIIFAFVFFTGLIVKNRIVELITSGILLLGAGVLVAMTIGTREWIWGLGTVFFLTCVLVINAKYQFMDEAQQNNDHMRNPYD